MTDAAPLRHRLKAAVPRAWRHAAGRFLTGRQCERADRRANRLARSDAPLLVVSERDAVAHAYEAWLAWAAEKRPALRRAIRLARVPGARLRDARVLHAWVQDPVCERDSGLFGALQALEAGVAARGGRVVNPAATLSHSLRDVMMMRLDGLEMRLPRVMRLPADLEAAPERYPVMVRPRWGHGVAMTLLEDPDAWQAWRAGARGCAREWVATEFIDVRSPDGFYRKYRFMSFGRHGLARHLIVSRNWEVRPKDRVISAATRTEELAFVQGDAPYAGVLERARARLGFDVAAFDFSYDASGALVLWEVNPYPDLSPPRSAAADYLRPVVEATYAALADFYEEELG